MIKNLLKVGMALIVPVIVLGGGISQVDAHSGRTDSRGGHTCRTNCPRYGLSYGQYHYHGGRAPVTTYRPAVTKAPLSRAVTSTATWAAQSPTGVIQARPGDVINFSLTIRNTSRTDLFYSADALLDEAPPYVGHHELKVGATNDVVYDNLFDFSYGGPWVNKNRFATFQSGPAVAPGQNLTFNWSLMVSNNATVGTHRYKVSVLQEWDGWFQGLGGRSGGNVYWDIAVSNPTTYVSPVYVPQVSYVSANDKQSAINVASQAVNLAQSIINRIDADINDVDRTITVAQQVGRYDIAQLLYAAKATFYVGRQSAVEYYGLSQEVLSLGYLMSTVQNYQSYQVLLQTQADRLGALLQNVIGLENEVASTINNAL